MSGEQLQLTPLAVNAQNPVLMDLIAAQRAVQQAIEAVLSSPKHPGAINAGTHAIRAQEFLASAAGQMEGRAEADIYARCRGLENAVRHLQIEQANLVATLKSQAKELDDARGDIDDLDRRTRGIAK